MKESDIRKRLLKAKSKASKIILKPCPHCGAKAELVIEIWGSSGEDRLGAFVDCTRSQPLDNTWCWARGAAMQESPWFLREVAKAWNRRA